MLWCDIYLLALLRHNRPQWDAKPINRNSPTTHHSRMQHVSRPSRIMQVEQYMFNFMFCKGTENTFRLLRYISFKESNTKWKCKAKATFPHSFVIHKNQLQDAFFSFVVFGPFPETDPVFRPYHNLSFRLCLLLTSYLHFYF